MTIKHLLIVLILLTIIVVNKSLAQTAKSKPVFTPIILTESDLPVEPMPSFPGGEHKFWSFVKANIREIKGTAANVVVIKMIVEVDGRLTNFKVARSANKETDAEVIRVLKLSPKWRPAIVNEKAQRKEFYIPFRFPIKK